MDPEQEQQMDVFTQSSSALFRFFRDPTTPLGSSVQLYNTDSGGCFVFPASGGNLLQKSQVGPVRLHLLVVQCRWYPDPVCRRRSLARKIRPGAGTDQGEARE